MNVSQLLKKLVVIVDIEIVIALLPEMFRFADEPSRDALLERLDRVGEGAALRLAEQQMNVLGHDDVSEDAHFVSTPDTFQRGRKCLLRFGRVEERASLITGEGNEVRTLRLVETLESPSHVGRLDGRVIPPKRKLRLSGVPSVTLV